MARRASGPRRRSTHGTSRLSAESILRTEREFVLALGGLSVGLAGATLLVHERVPVPRFNFLTVGRVDPGRRTALFERALDYYFQRAIRPSVRVPRPVVPHLDRALRALGFRPSAETVDVLLSQRTLPSVTPTEVSIRVDDRDSRELARLWFADRELPEFASALDVLRNHPNPGERLVPIVAEHDGALLGSAFVYRCGETALVFGVTTVPDARGRGIASAMTDWVRRTRVAGPRLEYGIISEQSRLSRRLSRMGFVRVAAFRRYELAADADLSWAPGSSSAAGPLWRPPRSSDAR
ncbi:MAG: GNAT family N-acetyltransferase [Thermoplasmata archaeon]